MHSPHSRNSCSWKKMLVPSGSPWCINECTLTVWGERGSTTNCCSIYQSPSPLPGNGMLQTLSGLGSLELCEPHPAIPGCAASSAQLCKSYPCLEKKPIFLLLNNTP